MADRPPKFRPLEPAGGNIPLQYGHTERRFDYVGWLRTCVIFTITSTVGYAGATYLARYVWVRLVRDGTFRTIEEIWTAVLFGGIPAWFGSVILMLVLFVVGLKKRPAVFGRWYEVIVMGLLYAMPEVFFWLIEPTEIMSTRLVAIGLYLWVVIFPVVAAVVLCQRRIVTGKA